MKPVRTFTPPSKPNYERHFVCKCNQINGVAIALIVLLIIMLIVICSLSYIIYIMRRKRYRKSISSENNALSKEYNRQPLSEVPESATLKKISSVDSPFKQSDILTMVDIDIKELPKSGVDSKPQTLRPKPDYIKTQTGMKHTMQPLLTPDQMSKVCVEVLSKMKRNQSTSLTHLNELIKSKNNEENTTRKKTAFEDDTEEYDVVPKPLKLQGADDEELGVYDCPPMAGNHATDSYVKQEIYDNLPVQEDIYENASFVQKFSKSNHKQLPVT